ncbi:MAG: hypothetical protein H6609_05440 [Ignavibacteriales bacterium]|nr:hypothetical protein [Ignavibacteriales bacterium]
MILKNIGIKVYSALLLFLFINSLIFSQDYKVGDVSDGSRLHPVHLLNLKDENGNIIDPNDEFALPFSTKNTCGNECHNYEKISNGFHFNFHDSTLISETKSEPWIYTDPTTLSVIPISYRKNKGSFTPDELKLSTIQFLFRFGPYYAGGDISELDSLENKEDFLRWMVSGKLETNCLICHDADPFYDQAEYASNIRKQNFKWAAAASSSFTEFKGNASKMPDNYDIYNLTTVQSIDQRSSVPPKLTYNKSKFNSENKVYFNLSKKIPNDNCYYCHSSIIANENIHSNWKNEEDVHLKAGLNCVDCHRNGIDHNMIKGVENKATKDSQSFTCEGCHTKNNESAIPTNGNLGAPIPEHLGIPPIHFERLSCTTCHSGNWPTKETNFVKISRAHFLGMHGTNKADNVFPHIQTGIFTESQKGKIEPQNLIWPSFWGFKDSLGAANPLPIKFVEENIRPILGLDSLFNFGDWPVVSDSLIISVLQTLDSLKITEGKPVFITGGKIFEVENNILTSEEEIYSNGYGWRTSHNVRPANQALGINGCQDCHSIGSPFFAKNVNIESSVLSTGVNSISASTFQNNNEIYQSFFSLTFFFRPWLKFIIIISALVLTVVMVGYFFKGIRSISSGIETLKNGDFKN